MAQHFMTWPTSSTAVCGSDMVGQRNTLLDTNPAKTTCPRCIEWMTEAEIDFHGYEV